MTDNKTPSPEWVHRLAPYVPGKPIDDLKRELGLQDIIKLASNENPLGASPAAVTAMREAASAVNLYPDPGAYALKAELASRLGVSPARIVVGNGSNELITNLVRALATPEQNIVASQYGFIAYRVCAGAAGVEFREVPASGLTADVDAMVAACDADTRIVFLANPNNPTGTFTTGAELARLVAGVPARTLLVIDEAYFEYVDDPDCPNALDSLSQRENLVVMRTFSKAYGIAGCRVGYAVVPEYVAERINRIREPFDVNHLAQVAALAALGDTEFLERSVRSNGAVRSKLYAGLDALGLTYWPSQTNFVLFESPIPPSVLNDALLRRGVIIRPMAPYGLAAHLRVTVGTSDQNDRFLSALGAILSEHSR